MTTDPRQKVRERLHRIEGQVRGIEKMLAEGRDCESVLTQLLAARSALEGVAVQLVATHLDDCLAAGSTAEARASLGRALQLLGQGR